MAGLQDVLVQVMDRIARYRGSPIGEQDTKAALIEPLLRSLEWEVENPEEVWREYKRKSTDNPVDYALLILRTPRLFVEAKGLGENLDDPRWAGQILGYAVVAGVEWVVLTNGDEYRIYNSHAPVPVEEKLFRSVRISDDQARAEETLALLSKERMKENWIDVLWKAHFVDRQIRAAIEHLFSATNPDPGMIGLLARKVPTLSRSEIRAALGRARFHLDFPIEPVPSFSTPSVRLLRPIDGPQAPAASRPAHGGGTPWRDVSIQDLVIAGLIRPPLELEKTYLGRRFTARIETDGQVVCLGQTFSSLSIAGGAARAARRGAPPEKKVSADERLDLLAVHGRGWAAQAHRRPASAVCPGKGRDRRLRLLQQSACKPGDPAPPARSAPVIPSGREESAAAQTCRACRSLLRPGAPPRTPRKL